MAQGQMSASAHQNWLHLFWTFDTQKECILKLGEFKERFPNIIGNGAHIHERGKYRDGIKVGTIWDLTLTINTGYLSQLLDFK